MVRLLFFALSAIVATAAATDADISPALEKVVHMIEDLQVEVVKEGKAEAKTYDKFACFCKDMTDEKTESIKAGQDAMDSLQADIEEKTADREALDEEITGYLKKIAEVEKKMKEAADQRAKELALYEINSADMQGALVALKGAIDALKTAKKEVGLSQLRAVVKTVRKASIMADALGMTTPKSAQVLNALLQETEVPSSTYEFGSGDIIKMLEELLGKFKDTAKSLDEDEEKAVEEFEKLMKELKKEKEETEENLEEAKKKKSEIMQEIATKSGDLTGTAATLLDDQEYMKELATTCDEKAKGWEQRTKVRADELSALTEALSIIKGLGDKKEEKAELVQKRAHYLPALAAVRSENTMEVIEAATEEYDDDTATSFVQLSLGKPRALLSALAGKALLKTDETAKVGTNHSKSALLANEVSMKLHEHVPPPSGFMTQQDKRLRVLNLLRKESQALKSSVLAALAAKVASDPFAKVKKLIQELIERLLQEAADEGNHKGWCDKETGKAKQDRNFKAEEITQLNGRLGTNEALRDKLDEEITVLEKEMKELEEDLASAEKIRTDEKAENEATIAEAEEAKEAVEEAIDVLQKFYKTAAKEGTFLQSSGVDEDAPDAGFDEPYKGKQGASGGIIGMLEVILSDFKRTIKETQEEERKAEQEYIEFTRSSKVSLATKKTAVEEKIKLLGKTKDQIAEDMTSLEDAVNFLDKAINELEELHSACVDTGMSYEERVAMREQEIEALKKALCILDSMGPMQSGEDC